ncbi:MAG: bifunctional oligoribonuclease/PAP phosphatase NrnA [Deltaproteobacteria bacterium]|nr:MAG: bifunctional oligoribonuclease/PAP phosphatase NrnA [Deltaproteobacteria bacterium]
MSAEHNRSSDWDEAVYHFVSVLKRYSSVLITAPQDADGDSVGAQLALRRMILALDGTHRVAIVNQEPCPARYRFLPESDRMGTPACLPPDASFDIGVVLDGGIDRIGTVRRLYEGCKVRVSIDHHAVREPFPYDIDLYEPGISSTAEMVARLIEQVPWPVPLTQTLAAQLYLGLIYDTGLFRHSNTQPSTLRLAARLLESGFDFTRIAEAGLLERSYTAQKIVAHVLSTAQRDPSGRLIWGVLSCGDLERYNATAEDREGIIDQLLLTRGVEIALFFSEAEGERVKVSLRSKGDFDVATLARELGQKGFGGGGHRKAAGCLLAGSLPEVVARVVERLRGDLGLS